MKFHFGQTKFPALLQFFHTYRTIRTKYGAIKDYEPNTTNWRITGMYGISFKGCFFGFFTSEEQPTF